MTQRLYIPPALQIISENIEKWGNPLGLTDKDCSAWARGLQIPEKGKTILYTGCEYQMISRIGPLLDVVKKVKFDDAAISALKRIQSASHSIGIDVTKVYARFGGADNKIYDRILQMAALVLKRFGVDFAYLNNELYSGALLFEYGLFEDFTRQAEKILKQFKEAGVSRIIALSPHSAEMFQKIYPQFIRGFNFEVIPYVCVVAEAWKKSGLELFLPEQLILTLQDPCHLARSLKVTEEPRDILRAIKNSELREPSSNREATMCCGAPCEIVYTELAELIALKRIQDFSATGAKTVVTLCPFCYANLSRGMKLAKKELVVKDFIEILYQALGIEE